MYGLGVFHPVDGSGIVVSMDPVYPLCVEYTIVDIALCRTLALDKRGQLVVYLC